MKLSLVRLLAMGVTWLTLTGGGCNLFEPAQPEPPNADAIIPDYSTPEQTLEMIAEAVRDKSRTNGSSVYIGAFATTPAYHHIFWHTDVTETGRADLAADWSISNELNFYSSFTNLRGDEYEFTWEPDDASGSDFEGERTAELHRRYRVTTATAEGLDTGTIALGYADLTLVKGDDGSWRITIWNDRIDPTAEVGVEEVTLGRRRLKPQ